MPDQDQVLRKAFLLPTLASKSCTARAGISDCAPTTHPDEYACFVSSRGLISIQKIFLRHYRLFLSILSLTIYGSASLAAAFSYLVTLAFPIVA